MQKIFSAIALLVLFSCGKTQTKNSKQNTQVTSHESTLEKDSDALFLTGAPSDIQSRHVWISNHSDLGKDQDFPVHICFRQSETDSWKFRGTGTILAKYPGFVFSAYHVFDGDQGQFAYRKIGPHELKNSSFEGFIGQPDATNHINDSIVCPTTKDKPTSIFVPLSKNTSSEWISSSKYKVTTFSKTARFSTYPEIPIRTIAMIEFEKGVYYVLLNWQVFPGESGTLVTIDESEGKLVLISGQSIPVQIVNALPIHEQLALNWNPTKMYAMCNWVTLK